MNTNVCSDNVTIHMKPLARGSS
jgi:hypothetical protein